jgi:hypothetical protein
VRQVRLTLLTRRLGGAGMGQRSILNGIPG